MANIFSPSATVHRNVSRHLCTRAIEGLLRAISGANIFHLDHAFRDLVKVLERALSVTSLNTAAHGCQFCASTPRIMRIADNIQTKLEMKDDVLRAICQLTAFRDWERLSNDCRELKELLQSIIDIDVTNASNTSNSHLSARVLDGAHNLWIDGAKITTIAGNSVRDSPSNVSVVIKQESGIGFRGVLILVLLAFLFFCLLC